MKYQHVIKINFKGGIISPGELYNILVAASNNGVANVRFGLRQQLLVPISHAHLATFTAELKSLGHHFEVDRDDLPNIVSSYPAEEIFITNTWLSEGIYKDIFDDINYLPRLKINVSDSKQSFTPMLTGNINWVASPVAQHFWHLFIRFPRTNVIYEWKEIVYTNDVARMSKALESLIIAQPGKFVDNPNASGDALYSLISSSNYNTKPADGKLVLPVFNLPYYEGLNRYHDKTWLGIYRRDELFDVNFLKEMCLLCLQTKIGQLCSTPWKSIVIKGIEEKDRKSWNYLLAKFQVNVRHAANELNFQVEDNCAESLALKNYIVKYLSRDDTRTFGICFGIKAQDKTEVFSSVLIRRRSLLRIGPWKFIHVYDILCAKDFNPNERTGFAFSRNNLRIWLPERIRRLLHLFYTHQSTSLKSLVPAIAKKEPVQHIEKKRVVYQCKDCMTVYDPQRGEPENNIPAGTAFDQLSNYQCSTCEAPAKDFVAVEEAALGLQTI